MNKVLRFIPLVFFGLVPLFLLMLLMGGCASTPADRKHGPVIAEWPEFIPPQPGETVFRVDSDASEILIRVDPDGPMARLGHSHAIGGPVISGTLVTGREPAQARLDLTIDAAALEVDKPEWRRHLGLEPELDADTVEGTRENMRSERVLDVAQHPEIGIRSVAVSGPGWMPTVSVRIRLRGEVRELAVPVAVVRSGPQLQAIGTIDLLQSDFGIEPFSTAGGALRVSDRMQIRFLVVAQAEPEAPE